MRRTFVTFGLLLAGVPALCPQTGKDWQSVFPVDRKKLGTVGSNPYFILTPGYRLSYRHGKDTVVDTVLNETKMVDGVETRVVEDRETRKGQLVELTRDYYAIDSATNDVYYMGEDVDVYKNGKVTGHEGAWLSGVKGAKFGLMMPGTPHAGQKFYLEQAPGVGMDRGEIVALNDRVVTPAGSFEKCIHIHETSAIEKGSGEHKWYAPGVGPVKDAEMLLVEYGPPPAGTQSQTPKQNGSPEDQAAIRTIVNHWQENWEKFDASVLKDDYAEDADWMNAFGIRQKGSANIVAFVATVVKRPQNQGRHTTWGTPEIRFLRPDVAVAFRNYQTGGNKAPDGSALPERHTHSTWILTRDEGKWRIVSHVISDDNGR